MVHRHMFKNVALLSSALYLCSCATIVSSGPKSLPIMSQPDEATCEVIDIRSGNTIMKAKTPYIATLETSAGFFQKAKYKVKITKEGYLPEEQQIDAGLNGWYYGNIVFGGLLGILIIDPGTGAMWKIAEDTISVKLYPDSAEGRIALAKERYNGESAFKNGDYDQAISDATTAIGYYPDYLDGYCIRCAAYAKIGKLDKAMADANKVIELHPEQHRGYKERADLHMLKGEFAEALSDLDKAVSIKPDYADALYLRGKTNSKLNKNVEAKADIQTACTLGIEAACNSQF